MPGCDCSMANQVQLQAGAVVTLQGEPDSLVNPTVVIPEREQPARTAKLPEPQCEQA
jgi:hypothetical protein